MSAYDVACPVCRQPHVVNADFLSSSRSVLATDGRVLPASSCGSHSAAEVRQAWLANQGHGAYSPRPLDL